ncbi:hypothetical protein ACH5RR_024566 [Cinchona calisaya]|uniref:Uncharacterized protein n=1 Tax=Cinchona calisaya TaxID=153742 RepID=A0ABD2YY78_9GENT
MDPVLLHAALYVTIYEVDRLHGEEEGEGIDRWVEILDEDKNPIRESSKIHVKLQFFEVAQDCSRAQGIRSSKFPGVHYTFFPQKTGCWVSLYQDAHVPDKFVSRIHLSGRKVYEPHRCWEDVFDAISNAKQLIYITGWSVYTEIILVRDSRRQKPGGNVTLRYGLMATHEETEQFFQGFTNFNRLLSHQKILVVDSNMPSGESQQRSIVSFVVAIDFCDGRYDAPFRTVQVQLFRYINAGAAFGFSDSPEDAAIAESGSVQAVLDWQRRRMEVMYKEVIKAWREKGLEEDPGDNLTFFCLGNLEVKKNGG